MLVSLTVENYALIERLEMQLDAGLNIITGETGAGKSILLGALGLLMGGKNDGVATRDNSHSCIVEGLFDISKLGLAELFESHEWDYEEQITLRRVITPAGKSRAFIGDMPVSLTELRELSVRLIDVHSQHQNLLLTDELFRTHSLDMLYDSRQIVDRYTELYGRRNALRSEHKELEEMARVSKRDEEWIRYQVDELNSANLRSGEDEQVESELKVLENSEQINRVLASFCGIVDGEDDKTLVALLIQLEREMKSIADSYKSAGSYAARIMSVRLDLKDLSDEIIYYNDDVESDPKRLAMLNERIDVLYTLCNKHKVQSVDELIELRERYSEQLMGYCQCDDKIERIAREIEQCEVEIEQLAQELHDRRVEAAPEFSRLVTEMLHRLGMPQGRFELTVERSEQLTARGGDRVEFLFSSVASRAMQPIDKIASGGEISRVMLSLKSLLSRKMELPTIIFDEIDTGVSGRIADSMGAIIYELSSSMQVIDITHLPQVAAKGDSHFVVYRDGSHTNIARLSDAERLDHIAMMLSGSEVTNAARTQAKMLLKR